MSSQWKIHNIPSGSWNTMTEICISKKLIGFINIRGGGNHLNYRLIYINIHLFVFWSNFARGKSGRTTINLNIVCGYSGAKKYCQLNVVTSKIVHIVMVDVRGLEQERVGRLFLTRTLPWMDIQRRRSLFPLRLFLRGNQHIHCFIPCSCPRNLLLKISKKRYFTFYRNLYYTYCT